MNSYYLRALSRDDIVSACITAGALVDDDDGLHAASADIVWDEIGLLCEETGDVDADGLPLLALISDVSGTPYWHANVYSREPLTLPADLLAEPASPQRVLWQ